MQAEAVNGYVSGFEVYTGKKSDSMEKGLRATVVKTLSDDMHHTHRHLYFDNFFSSVDLLLDLFRDRREEGMRSKANFMNHN